MWELTNATKFYGVTKKILRRSFNLEIMSYGFPKEKKHIWANSRKDGLVHSGYSIAYPIILFFLFLFINPILVNVNKLKPYTYVDKTLKGIQSSEDQKSL
jgi:hypothetical protein